MARQMIYETMQQAIGRTPHLRVRAPEIPDGRIYVKLEGLNPTGSVKDRAGLGMIRDALAAGTLRPGVTLLDASSGNMACALAYFGRLLGHPARVVVSSKLTEDKRNFLRYYGADIVQVGGFTIEGNQWCRELIEREGGEGYCFIDQLHNWSNPRAHYEGTGPEILESFPDVELVVGSLGSGGTLYGTGLYLKENRPGIKIVAVESAPGTKLPGTGSFESGDYVTPFIRKGRDDRIFDFTIRITEAEAVRRTLQLRDQGVFCGLQTGGVYHAALQAVRDLGVRGDVVFISGDAGWKNIDKLLPHADARPAGAA
ncbi:MAG TPA: cysteine synthase family protein [Longimicrobiaceae bacterium]|nr:cysteine synthase family protein [Longimicrobiaceae bacterium]